MTAAAPAPRELPPAQVRRLRNAALIALAGNDNLGPTVLARLRGDSVVVRPGQALLQVLIRREGGHTVAYLDDAQTRALGRYLEAAGLWHAPRPLFDGLGVAGVKQVLWRSRGGR